MQRIAICDIQRSKFIAKLMEAFHLVFEWRESVRQAPHLDLQPLKTTRKSLRIGDEEWQIQFSRNPQKRLNPPVEDAFPRIPFAIHARRVIQTPDPVIGEGCPLPQIRIGVESVAISLGCPNHAKSASDGRLPKR